MQPAPFIPKRPPLEEKIWLLVVVQFLSQGFGLALLRNWICMLHLKNKAWISHAALWLFIYLFVFDYHFIEDNWLQAVGTTFIETLSYAVIFYLNYGLLIPRILEAGQKTLYLLACVGAIALYIFLIRILGLESTFYEMGGWRDVFSMTLNTTLFLLVSGFLWYSNRAVQERERRLQLKAQQAEAELKFLRNQISPHFIFNTLNNVYTLALQKHDNAAPMVARLSSLMRYALYDVKQTRVPLQKELDAIRGYLDLELLRKPSSTNVDFYTEGDFSGLTIPPLLLLSFTENCFKHGDLNTNPEGFVRICCTVEKDAKLNFTTENSFSAHQIPDETGGIGMDNSQRRLELEFKQMHTLETTNEAGVFKVLLSLPVSALKQINPVAKP